MLYDGIIGYVLDVFLVYVIGVNIVMLELLELRDPLEVLEFGDPLEFLESLVMFWMHF